ncbi:MAG TPA: efflux RND transporter periplasmic adaptor subunit [Candidatus Limnocylindrales bacterium]|nr:efflux RND transporter periplasmic adaptor subunit [Candidatus Limnocylindrales bacterium]
MKSKSVRRSLIVLAVVTLLLPVVVLAMRANQAAAPAATTSLQTYTVAPGTVELTVSALGRVEPDRETRLAFTTAGRAQDVLVAQGDTVAEGDALIRLNDETQRLALEQARLGLQTAELQRERLLAGPDETQLRSAEANVQAAQGAAQAVAGAVAPQDVEAATLAYQQAQQALADAQTARQNAGAEQAQSAYDLLDARVGQASFQAEIARLQLADLQAGRPADLGAAYARVAQAQAALDQLQAGPTDLQLQQADAQVAQAQLEVDRAQMALDRMTLSAPHDGIVTSILAEPGMMVAPGVAMVTVTDIDPLRLNVQVDEIDVRRIREGMPARVRFDALPGVTLPGLLETIAPVSSTSGGIVYYDVSVRLDDRDARVRVGMTAESAFVVDRRDGVLVVPNQYIRLDRDGGKGFVNVLNAAGELTEVPVTLGLEGEDSSEITDELEAGDVVAVDLAGDSLSLLGG